MSETLQHAAVSLIVLAALLFLVRHLTGWPRIGRKKPKAERAVLGERLARGLAKAKDRTRD